MATVTKEDKATEQAPVAAPQATAAQDSSTGIAGTTGLPATRPAGPAGTVQMGLAPRNLEEGWRLAQILSKSGLVPEDFRGKPENVLVAIQLGMEIGFAPMQALQSIAVINGRPSVWGDGFLALIMASTAYREHDEYYEVDGARREGLTVEDWKKPTTAAVCTFWRRDRQMPTTARFTVAQAHKADLLTKKGPWQTYPDRMLKMRARSWAGRDAFPDILRGIKTTEEVLDTPLDELQPITVEPVHPRRASEAHATTSPQPASSPGTAPAPEPATAGSPSSAPASAATRDIRGLKVITTNFVKPPTGEPYYEVVMKSTTNRDLVFLTREEQVYKEAASFEGSEHQVTVTVHDGVKPAGEQVLVLDRLALYEGGAGQGLFE